MNIRNEYIVLKSILRSVWYNFRLLPFSQAIKLPILFGPKIHMDIRGGGVEIDSDKLYFGMIRLGMTNGSKGVQTYKQSFIILPMNSKITFKGKVTISRGFTIRCGTNAKVVIGDNFFSNQNFKLFCSTRIDIKNDCLIGWNVELRDSDGHKILNEQCVRINENLPIIIGSHVWIGADCTVMKGVCLANDLVVAKGSIVVKSILDSNCIIAGVPAKIVKRNILWKK